MERQLETYQKIERSIIKKFRKELWKPFIVAVKRYELIQAGRQDRRVHLRRQGFHAAGQAACRNCSATARCLLRRSFLVMDPGYNELNRRKIEQNAALLNVPITDF